MTGKMYVALIVIALGLAAVGGWIANIVKLCGMGFDHVTGLLVARGVGILVAPLGAILGYF